MAFSAMFEASTGRTLNSEVEKLSARLTRNDVSHRVDGQTIHVDAVVENVNTKTRPGWGIVIIEGTRYSVPPSITLRVQGIHDIDRSKKKTKK